MAFDFDIWQRDALAQIEKALETFTHRDGSGPLNQAMRYAVLGNGKRLRPLLVLASARAVNALDSDMVMRAACAAELIHAYSLVHDDMPCMDNDVLRRGLPTVHVQYGQALALLAGDALQTLAFEVLSPLDEADGDSHGEHASQLLLPALLALRARLVALLARAAGADGMAGGQAIDLCHVGETLNEQQLQQMHTLKTGQLLSCCVAMGVACAGQPLSSAAQSAMAVFGRNMGLAFQIVDDILDATQESAVIGKTAGKDAQAGKPTYVSILGLEAARHRVCTLYDETCLALQESGLQNVDAMLALAAKMVSRSF